MNLSNKVNALTHQCHLMDKDEDKVKAIFDWITSNIQYDVEAFMKGRSDLEQLCLGPRAIKSGKALCSGFADLFCRLCRSQNIKSTRITGIAKGSGYQPGNTFSTTQTNHEWNAVCINSKWQLVDCCWGTGHLEEKTLHYSKYTNYHYLLTDPKEFITDHFPSDSEWQLLDDSVSIEDFEKFANYKSSFFLCHLRLVSDSKSVLDVNKESSIVLSYEEPVLMKFKLELEGKNVSNIENCTGCSHCLSIEHDTSQKKLIIIVRPHLKGLYFLRIYAKLKNGERPMKEVLKFKVKCQSVYGNIMDALSMQEIWGVTKHGKNLGISLCNPCDKPICTQDGTCQLDLNIPKENLYNMKLSLHEFPSQKECSMQHIFLNRYGNIVTVHVAPPSDGLYKLTIKMAKGHCSSSSTVAQFLIKCIKKSDIPFIFPIMYPKWNGNFCLIEPFDGNLVENRHSMFFIEAPHAASIVLVEENNITHLKEENKGMWKGLVWPQKAGNTLRLSIKFHGRNTSYYKLLEYPIQGK